MKISFIATVYNEELTIDAFLDSLLAQTQLPDEVVIVDGGSSDATLDVIARSLKTTKQSSLGLLHYVRNDGKRVNIKILVKKGNRSVGRNEAIRNATGDIIIASDAGCTLDKDWVKEITGPFRDKKVDVVAGYYHPVARTAFEKCMATYTSVMPDNVDPDNFLPSSRSVGFKKSVWEKVGGYPEELDTCEDLVFAKRLKEQGFQFAFAKDAIVYWPQRHNIKEAFSQFYSYAVGDGQAWYIRPQTPLLFLRYVLALVLISFAIFTRSNLFIYLLSLIFILYVLWAIRKNHRYVNEWQAFYLLPLLQFTADFAVLMGTTAGLSKRLLNT